MATNYTKWANHRENVSGSGCVVKLTSNEVDQQGLSSTDTIELFKVPKGSIPIACIVEIKEASGEARTIDVGDVDGDTDGLIDGASLAGAAGTVIQTAVGADISGSLAYLTEATIIATCATGTAYAAGKFVVHLWIVT